MMNCVLIMWDRHPSNIIECYHEKCCSRFNTAQNIVQHIVIWTEFSFFEVLRIEVIIIVVVNSWTLFCFLENGQIEKRDSRAGSRDNYAISYLWSMILPPPDLIWPLPGGSSCSSCNLSFWVPNTWNLTIATWKQRGCLQWTIRSTENISVNFSGVLVWSQMLPWWWQWHTLPLFQHKHWTDNPWHWTRRFDPSIQQKLVILRFNQIK